MYLFRLPDKALPWQPHFCQNLVGRTSSFHAIQMKHGTHDDPDS